jgi:Pyruvate/2-oxoacid:ferredoxin oxidoreductase gamma subunit
LALRAAAAAGVNITYKILYNDAVAMTGGQPAEGGLSVAQIAHQVAAEGANRIAIVSDEPGKYPGGGWPQAPDRPVQLQLDFSCVEGFCPSFVTVHGGRPKRAVKPAFAVDDLFGNLPVPPARPLEQPYNILIAGIGGTGVITIGALLGMAAHLEGKGCSALDFTGLAQKNGAVMSHVRIAAQPEDIGAVRIAAGGADLLLGCDIVVSASPAGLSRAEYTKTRAIINADLQPTASFVINPDIDFEIGAMQRAIRDAVGDDHLDIVDATGIGGWRPRTWRGCARRRASGRSPNVRPKRSTKRSPTAAPS